MKKRTLKVIIILVGLLFLNIEAAQAGLIRQFRLYIRHEFTDYQVLYILLSLLILGSLGYIIFAPVMIGKEKWAWLNYYSYNPNRHKYSNKRQVVRRISGILRNSD